VDELLIYQAPHLMGDGARGLFHLPGLERMDQRIWRRLGRRQEAQQDARGKHLNVGPPSSAQPTGSPLFAR
jgi:riboflavin biosynthesis pyrimidine reductase